MLLLQLLPGQVHLVLQVPVFAEQEAALLALVVADPLLLFKLRGQVRPDLL